MSQYRAVNSLHHCYKNQSINVCEGKVAVSSEFRTEHSTLIERHVEMLNVKNIVGRKETARLKMAEQETSLL